MRSEPCYCEGDNPAEPIRQAGGSGPSDWCPAVARGLAADNFLFLGFNLIVLTSNLLVARPAIGLSNFTLAAMSALVVGKAVLVANKIPLLRRYDRAPLTRLPLSFDSDLGDIVARPLRGSLPAEHILLYIKQSDPKSLPG
jgi:hypothetical protein